jgi:DNA repair exonuclease SbcCD nuclease subunit
MTDRLRIAHCADIHLDASVYGEPAPGGGDFHRGAFAAALAAMRAHRPDLMLLAGDLFDSNRATVGTVEWAMETLGRETFPIVMIPGNHDCVESGGVFARHDFNRIPNVTLLAAPDGAMVRLPALGVAAWGKGMVEHSPEFRPLGGCPDRPADCRWYLGLGHGLFVPHGGETHRSSPIHMREIEACACDYLALGHHHAAMEIVTDTTTAAYSGSPTDDIGRGATYVIVDLVAGMPPLVQVHTVTK